MVSPGCTKCYAMLLALARLEHVFRNAYKKAGFSDWQTRPVWGDKATRVKTKGFWKDALRWNTSAAGAAVRPRVFPSMIDWLDECPAGMIDQDGTKLDPIEVLAELLKLIHDTPNLDWLLLTKRPEKFDDRMGGVANVFGQRSSAKWDTKMLNWVQAWRRGDAIPTNIWIGASVEDQRRADERIPHLLKIPAKVRFLSVEPMLGPINFPLAAPCGYYCECDSPGVDWPEGHRPGHGLSGIHWMIFGGESGPGARPCNLDWIGDGVRQCRAAGVKVFVKQLGAVVVTENANMFDWPDDVRLIAGKPDDPGFAFAYIKTKDSKGGDPAEWPEDLRIREFPEVASLTEGGSISEAFSSGTSGAGSRASAPQ